MPPGIRPTAPSARSKPTEAVAAFATGLFRPDRIAFTGRSFGFAVAVGLIPTFALAAIAALIAPAPELNRLALGPGWLILVVGLVVPAVESFLLIGPLSYARQALRRHAAVCAVGAAPLVLLHAFNAPLHPLVVAWPFVWQAHCYLVLRRRRVPFWRRYAFVTALHAAHNGVAVALSLV